MHPPVPDPWRWLERLARVESRNITHLTPDFPVFWEEARGSNVRDVDGNIYLDLTGAFGCPRSVGPFGRAGRGRDSGSELGVSSMGWGMCTLRPRRWSSWRPWLALGPWPDSRVILGSSGSEAVEAALKTSLLVTGRPGILAFEGAYHGLTLGSLATTHREDFRGPFLSRLYQGVRFAPFPESGDGDRAVQESLDKVRWLLREGDGGDEVGAVIIEPIQGRAGVRIPPPGYLEALADLTWNANALLIFDEIFTGLGRTGALFAFHHEGVVPDLLCLGKGPGRGSSPECLRWVRPESWTPGLRPGERPSTRVPSWETLSACAAGLALPGGDGKRGVWWPALWSWGNVSWVSSRPPWLGLPQVSEVRGRGLLVGVDLRHPGSTTPIKEGAVRAATLALREGILVLPAGVAGHVLELSPPLVITEEQLDWAVARLRGIFEEALAQ